LLIDWLGFIFAYGKRKVSPAQWENLSTFVPSTSKTVGVFVNPALEEVGEIFQKAPLDLVQLHGQESPEFCCQVKDQFGCKLIKVIGISEDGQANLGLESYADCVDYILLDTMTKTQAGGTGKVFAWDRIPAFQTRCSEMGVPLLVAGGLNAENIEKLIQYYQPFGIDLSSGVETDGIKDIGKIGKVIQVVERMALRDGNRDEQEV
jgi:phosphoribosylanthranilate isomerase